VGASFSNDQIIYFWCIGSCDDLLQQLLGSYNADIIDSNDIAEKLLFLDNITISYRNTNEVSSIIV